jgi:hypothetical protein
MRINKYEIEANRLDSTKYFNVILFQRELQVAPFINRDEERISVVRIIGACPEQHNR